MMVAAAFTFHTWARKIMNEAIEFNSLLVPVDFSAASSAAVGRDLTLGVRRPTRLDPDTCDRCDACGIRGQSRVGFEGGS